MISDVSRRVRLWALVPAAAGLLLVGACSDDPPDPVGNSNFGEILASVTTTGYAPDFPETFEVAFAGGGAESIDAVDGETVLVGAPAGPIEVSLSELPANCTAGTNPQTVTVVAGEEVTADFTVTCAAVTGSGTVDFNFTGVDIDPELTIVVDSGTAGERIELASTAAPFQILNLTPGDRELRITGLAGNCAITQAVDTITVTVGADAQTTFEAVCSPNVGDLVVNVTTTGATPDPDGYSVELDGAAPAAIGVNGSVTFDDISAGPHTVVLAGAEANCTIAQATRNVTVAYAETTTVDYTVTCP